jgi:hypothetical protein
MKLFKFLLGGGICIVPIFIIYSAIAISLIAIDQWNKGIVFYTGIVFAVLFIASMLYSVFKSLKR